MNISPICVKENMEYYTWDSSIGKYGGFFYKNSNNEKTNFEIELYNIGEIQECLNNQDYSHINDCIGISNTTIDLNNIPKGSKYGWDKKNYCWVYYKNNEIYPSYFSKKIESV